MVEAATDISEQFDELMSTLPDSAANAVHDLRAALRLYGEHKARRAAEQSRPTTVPVAVVSGSLDGRAEPCPHPDRKGRHETYRHGTGMVCRACGAEWDRNGKRVASRYPSGDGPLRHTLTAAVLDLLHTGGAIYVVQGGVKRPWSAR